MYAKGMNAMEHLMMSILDNSCGQLDPQEVEANGGFQQYFIETHCTGWTVRARIVERGEHNVWEIASFEASGV